MSDLDFKPTILIADDETENREILRTVLEDEGYPVVLAKDGRDVLRKAELDVGIILLDLRMPVLDGVSACERLKENPRTKDIPVIVLTACDHQDVCYEVLAMGAFDFLLKPVSLNELLVRVAAITKLLKEYKPEQRHWAYRQMVKTEKEREAADEKDREANWHAATTQ